MTTETTNFIEGKAVQYVLSDKEEQVNPEFANLFTTDYTAGATDMISLMSEFDLWKANEGWVASMLSKGRYLNEEEALQPSPNYLICLLNR